MAGCWVHFWKGTVQCMIDDISKDLAKHASSNLVSSKNQYEKVEFRDLFEPGVPGRMVSLRDVGGKLNRLIRLYKDEKERDRDSCCFLGSHHQEKVKAITTIQSIFFSPDESIRKLKTTPNESIRQLKTTPNESIRQLKTTPSCTELTIKDAQLVGQEKNARARYSSGYSILTKLSLNQGPSRLAQIHDLVMQYHAMVGCVIKKAAEVRLSAEDQNSFYNNKMCCVSK